MTYRDPSQELLKAYVNLLKGSIVYGGEVIIAGTRIPRSKSKYVHIYIESVVNYSTGDKVIYNVTMALQVVSMQDVTEGDETAVNSILDQVLSTLSDNDAIIMTNFYCLNSQFGDMEYFTELTDSNYNIIKKLRMSHFIEQKS